MSNAQCAHAQAGAAADGVADLEALEAVRVLGLLAHGVQDLVNHLCALGVVALRAVVARAGVLVHEVVRAEELAERGRADRVDDARLQAKRTARGTYFPPDASW